MKLLQRAGWLAALLTLTSMVTACAAGAYVGYDGSQHEWPRKHYLLDIQTQPDGAAITVNHEFVGKSPVRWLVPLSIARGQGILVEALPSEPGQETQRAVISTAGRNWGQPVKVFMAMNLQRVSPKHRYEIDVQ